MALITWTIEADFDRDDAYSFDLTPYVEQPGGGITINRAMGIDGVYRASRLEVHLSNKDGTFTPDNTASSIFGQMRPGVPIRIKSLHNAVNTTIYTGYWQSSTNVYRAGRPPMLRVTVDDLAAWLHKYSPVDLSVATRVTGAAMTTIAGNIGLAGGDYSIDTGEQTMPVHFLEGADALQAFTDIARAELGGLFWINKAGLIRFEDRVSRIGVSSPDETWGDGTNIFPTGIDYRFNDNELISRLELQANIYITSAATEVLFEFSRNDANQESLLISANTTYGPVRLSFGTPVNSITTPASAIDYRANSSADGTGSDVTANVSVTLTLQGAGYELTLQNTSGSDLYITHFQVRGVAEEFVTDNPIFFFKKVITNDKIDRGAQIQIPFAADGAALRDFGLGLLHTYRYVYPSVTLHMHAKNDDTKAALLGLEIGDQVKYVDTALGVDVATNSKGGAFIDDWFYVEGISINIPPHWGGNDFTAQVRLIPSWLYFDTGKMVHDNFGRANASGDLGIALSGDTWANDGNMDITSFTARANSDTIQVPDLDLGASATDHVVEVTLTNIGAGDEVGVILRKQDASNYYRVYLDKGSDEVIAEKFVGGVMTELASPAFTVGTGHEIRVRMQGTRMRVDVDYKQYIDTTDSALSSGTKVGLMARNANATTTFDDFHGRRI